MGYDGKATACESDDEVDLDCFESFNESSTDNEEEIQDKINNVKKEGNIHHMKGLLVLEVSTQV